MNKLKKNEVFSGKRELRKYFPTELDMRVIKNKDNEKVAVMKFIKARLSDDLVRAMKWWFLYIILWGVLLAISLGSVLLSSYMFGIGTLIPLSFTVIGCYLAGISLTKKRISHRKASSEKKIEIDKILKCMDIGARFGLFVASYSEYIKILKINSTGNYMEIVLPMIAVSAILLGLYLKKTADLFYWRILVLHEISECDVEHIYNGIRKDANEKD